MEQEEFVKQISQYWSARKISTPSQPNLSKLVPSANKYVDQRVVNRNKEKEIRSGDLSRLVKKFETLSGNLNYKKTKEEWRTFYTFPEVENAKKYIREEGQKAKNVVNFNERAPDRLRDDIIEGLDVGDYRLSKIKFLTGTTGVGKTTFLKYFSKIYREELLINGVVISRVRFRDIQDYKKEFSTDIYTAMKLTILNCLVRDVCASADFDLPSSEENDLLIQARIAQSAIRDSLLDTLLTADEAKGWDAERIIDELEKDEDVLLELPESKKAQFILNLQKQLKFCIILDGFDAMRPEEIALMQDKKEADFFLCLSSILKNAVSRANPAGRCLKKINKLFLVAARPITITQLKDEIEGETDNNQYLMENSHVIGTSIESLIRNRISVHLSKNLAAKQKMKKLQDGISIGIKYVMRLLRREHSTIREGRFIDLFNHNIREKVRFLADVIDLLAYKVEMKYQDDFSSVPFEALEKLDVDRFIEYLGKNHSQLGIELYEIQKLLILNKQGYYKNYFHHNTAGVLIPESQRGQFDNIFNYENRSLFESDNVEAADRGQYSFAKDPLLEKFFILYRLSNSRQLALPVLEGWFEDNFVYQRCRRTTLRQMIRNGILLADYVDDVIFMTISHKGRFVFEELIGVSVYLEHVLLNCQVPHFLSEAMIKPQDSTRRVWGRQSVTNVTLFLKYVEMVAFHSIRRQSLPLQNEIGSLLRNKIQPSVLDSFRGIISEGLEYEYMRSYSIDLKNELIAADIIQPAT